MWIWERVFILCERIYTIRRDLLKVLQGAAQPSVVFLVTPLVTTAEWIIEKCFQNLETWKNSGKSSNLVLCIPPECLVITHNSANKLAFLLKYYWMHHNEWSQLASRFTLKRQVILKKENMPLFMMDNKQFTKDIEPSVWWFSWLCKIKITGHV